MPTLIWQRPSPIPWSGLTAFDDQHVIAYNMARMWSYDIATGALRWTATLDPHVGFGDDWGVELAGETFFWWGPQRVYACDSTTGQQRWVYASPRGAIRSLCLEDDVIGLFVEMPGSYEQSPEHKAIILDRADGTVLDELAVPRPEPELAGPVMVRGKPYRPVRLPSILPGRTGPEADAGYANAVLLDGVLPVEVDWQNRTVRTGQPAIALTNKQVVDARFEVYDTCVCLRGMNEDPPRHKDRLYRLWQRSDLTKRRVPPNQRWAVADGQLYTFANHRLHRHDLREGKAAWHSDAMPKAARKIIPVGQKIFVVMEDDSFYEKGVRDVSQVKLYDRETGQELQACDLPKRWMHHIHPHEDGLVIWDINFLYRLGLPENSSVAVADEKMLDRAQPDALAAIRLARDLESPRVVTVNKIDDSPTIDGDLDEWSGLQAIDLTAASHFKPDFAQTSVAKHRAVRSDEDLAARIYCASADGTVYIAVEVQDDTHVANSSPGLWRNDSVSLMAAHPHLDLTDPLIATFACLPGVTRIEVGNPVQVMVAPDPPGVVPDVIQQARTIDASIAAAMLSLPAGDSEIQAASRRHDALGITCYEFAVPQSWLDSADGARFDLVIHDNDGQGRKGALHLASLHWSIEETARTGASYRKGAHGHPSAP
jgi:hypothetical protein